MKEAESRTRSNVKGRASGELRVVAIHCHPAPDARDRLRRLFMLLLEHTAGERQIPPVSEDEARDDGNGG